MDQGEFIALTLLDLSAAFDTIDHATLTKYFQIGMEYLGRLKFGFLICKIGTNQEKIKTLSSLSDKLTLLYGVPQGSVLGPVLLTLYTTPLSAIISSFDINHHLYADDIKIFMFLSVSNAKESLEKHCTMACRPG